MKANKTTEGEEQAAAYDRACFINDYPDFGKELLERFGSLERAKTKAEDDYAGCYDSLEDYVKDTIDISEDFDCLAPYIDYEAIGQDIEVSGDIYVIDAGGKLHIFLM